MRILHFLLMYLILTLLGFDLARASSFHPDIETLEFLGNSDGTFSPGSKISTKFQVNTYSFASSEYEYILFAVLPSSVPPTREEIERWGGLFYLVARTPMSAMGAEVGNENEILLSFDAPYVEGTFRIYYQDTAFFREFPLHADDESGSFRRVGSDETSRIMMQSDSYYVDFITLAQFTVKNSTTASAMKLYLTLDGKIPGKVKIKTGTVPKPLEIAWSLSKPSSGGKDPKGLSDIEFRYQLFPQDERLGGWSSQRSAKFYFLSRGQHRFAVQARARIEGKLVESPVARYVFTLDHDRISEPEQKGDRKPVSDQGKVVIPPVNFDSVYAKSKALLVGIYNFDDPELSDFDPVKIHNDVKRISESLIKNQFEITTVIGDRVTRSDVAKALDNLVRDTGQDDRLFIYFSSHGFADEIQAEKGYVATSDCFMDSPFDSCVSLANIQERAEAAGRKARQVLIAVDSCFSGLGVVTKAGRLPNLNQLAIAPGIFMLTAGMADQTAEIDSKLNMSVFSYFLAEGLSGGARIYDKGGIMTLSELLIYVQYSVAKYTDSRQIPMLGRVKGNGEMLFRPVNSN